MKLKSAWSLVILVAAGTLFVISASLRISHTDNRIEASARKSHVFKTLLKHDSIKIMSKDGAVTLTGTVADSSHKSLAQDTAESLLGVKSVDNQLKVKGESHAEHSDGSTSTRVKTTLPLHRNVSASETEVSPDGIFSLRGEASSQAQKELATEYAKNAEGAKEVKNETPMANAPAQPVKTMGEEIDNASFAAQVMSSLLSPLWFGVLRTKVETTESVVTWSGEAGNTAEKSLVPMLVTDIHGVRDLINNKNIASDASKTDSAPRPVQNLKVGIQHIERVYR